MIWFAVVYAIIMVASALGSHWLTDEGNPHRTAIAAMVGAAWPVWVALSLGFMVIDIAAKIRKRR